MKKRSPNNIILFLCTLSATVLIGLAALFVMRISKTKPAAGNGRNTEPIEAGVFYFSKKNENEDKASVSPIEEADESNTDFLAKNETVNRFGDALDDPEYLNSNKIYVEESRDDDSSAVTLTFAGDILFDDEYAVFATLKERGGDISSGVDPELIDIMSSSDITMVNNEFAYTYGGEPIEDKTYTFRADPPTASYLRAMGANVVGIANNHAYDFGEEGFLDTLSAIESCNLPYTGGGRNINEASSPVYFVVDGLKVGIIAATQIERLDNPDTKGATDSSPGVFRCFNPARLLETVADMKQKCDFVVVFIHWGTESTNELDWLQTDQAPKIAEAGADLIIGSHPHVLQPIGTSKGVPVVYSLGNFWFNSKELDTCLIQAAINSEGIRSLRFIPCKQSGCRTFPAKGTEYDRILNDMRAMSPGIYIDQEGYITY